MLPGTTSSSAASEPSLPMTMACAGLPRAVVRHRRRQPSAHRIPCRPSQPAAQIGGARPERAGDRVGARRLHFAGLVHVGGPGADLELPGGAHYWHGAADVRRTNARPRRAHEPAFRISPGSEEALEHDQDDGAQARNDVARHRRHGNRGQGIEASTKLGQNKSLADRLEAARMLGWRGGWTETAMADAMRADIRDQAAARKEAP